MLPVKAKCSYIWTMIKSKHFQDEKQFAIISSSGRISCQAVKQSNSQGNRNQQKANKHKDKQTKAK